MKIKSVSLLLVLVLLVGCGCVQSCSGVAFSGADVALALEMACAELSAENNMAVFYSDRTRSSQNVEFSKLGGEDFGFLYYGKYEVPACFEKVVDIAVRLPLDTSGFEVHIVECVDLSAANEVAKMLMERVDRMQGAQILDFAPEGYEICFRGAIVCVFSRYACLFATPDNSVAERVVRRVLG